MRQRIVGHFALHLNKVAFGQFVFWVGNPRLQSPVVGQQHQPLTVHIQPTCGIDAGHIDKLRQRRPRRPFGPLVGELRQDAIRFVEQDDAGHLPALAKAGPLRYHLVSGNRPIGASAGTSIAC